MRRLFQFSEKTFRSLSVRQQHKKCAELLKELFLFQKKQAPFLDLWKQYQNLCHWMSLPLLVSKEQIEGRYHTHLDQAGMHVKEHDFLILQHDTESVTPWLHVHTYLDKLRSCHNVGSIIRTVEAFRLGPVHFSQGMMPLDHPHIVKTSMGAHGLVPLSTPPSLEALPRPWIAVETVAHAVPWNTHLYPSPCTLIFGNEKQGISQDILTTCDTIIGIPLVGCKNSLNVANAFAIVAAEVAWQHRM